MYRNIIQKIWENHVVIQKKGHPAIFSIDLQLIHEVTSAQAFKMLEEKRIKVSEPNRVLATIDHSIPTTLNRTKIADSKARQQIAQLRENCKKNHITLFDIKSGDQGIVHVIGPELGLTQPGMTIVCGDSHTSTHGAFGALGFGIGTSEIAHVLATGCLLIYPPKTMKVEFIGIMPNGVYAKDLILALIRKIGIAGANGHIIQYIGPSIHKMSMEARMTICNMSIECGARAGLIEADATTFNYLRGKKYAPKGNKWKQAIKYWKALTTHSKAHFDQKIKLNIESLEPLVTWGINPEQVIQISESIPHLKDIAESKREITKKALKYVNLKEGQKIEGVPIDYAFIGSCTNARIEDLRIVAQILKIKKVHKNVKMYIVPGSEKIHKMAIDEGLNTIFQKAGAQFRLPGCSMCIAMNEDRVPGGKRCVSSTNRNFIGRQGPGSITHLASPATVAASAIEGKITSPVKYV